MEANSHDTFDQAYVTTRSVSRVIRKVYTIHISKRSHEKSRAKQKKILGVEKKRIEEKIIFFTTFRVVEIFSIKSGHVKLHYRPTVFVMKKSRQKRPSASRHRLEKRLRSFLSALRGFGIEISVVRVNRNSRFWLRSFSVLRQQ